MAVSKREKVYENSEMYSQLHLFKQIQDYRPSDQELKDTIIQAIRLLRMVLVKDEQEFQFIYLRDYQSTFPLNWPTKDNNTPCR